MSEWIKCSERLPEEGVTVLASTLQQFFFFYWITPSNAEAHAHFINTEAWEWDFSMNEEWEINGELITSWMPLPEPPQEKDPLENFSEFLSDTFEERIESVNFLENRNAKLTEKSPTPPKIKD